MQVKVIREMVIYTILLVTLALLMHPDLLSTPTQRISLFQDRQNYFHPLLYTFIVYILFFLPIRYIFKKIRNIFTKKAS